MNLTHDTTSLGVVADIGGRTHAWDWSQIPPNALSTSGVADERVPSLTALIEDYLARLGIQRPRNSMYRDCRPHPRRRMPLTNLPLRFSIEQTQQELELTRLEVINDFDAIARYVPHLNGDDTLQVGPREAERRTRQGRGSAGHRASVSRR